MRHITKSFNRIIDLRISEIKYIAPKRTNEKETEAIEINALRRALRKTTLDSCRNETILERINLKEKLLKKNS